jgi:hypothetical protein
LPAPSPPARATYETAPDPIDAHGWANPDVDRGAVCPVHRRTRPVHRRSSGPGADRDRSVGSTRPRTHRAARADNNVVNHRFGIDYDTEDEPTYRLQHDTDHNVQYLDNVVRDEPNSVSASAV